MSYPTTVQQALTLGPELTIAHAAAWRACIVQALGELPGDDGAELCLDLAEVTDIDSSAIQLLLATEHSLHQRGGTLRLAAVSGTVSEALTTLGLRQRWDEPQAVPPV